MRLIVDGFLQNNVGCGGHGGDSWRSVRACSNWSVLASTAGFGVSVYSSRPCPALWDKKRLFPFVLSGNDVKFHAHWSDDAGKAEAIFRSSHRRDGQFDVLDNFGQGGQLLPGGIFVTTSDHGQPADALGVHGQGYLDPPKPR